MTPYEDSDHDSGVAAYEIGSSYIDVQFKSGAAYRYSSRSVGAANLNQMIQLARAGEGLNSFINRVVPNSYEARLR
ncbi:hypothetical protein [Cohaesibacter marisflavi]|uniref:hypothetical protein n=1 Tax=Cohaesibacter marisflavi TaxID=655353 RepID=UPI0029C8DF73|nr:hypothetical protein [Cohaesibacter marisflavi]